MKCSCFIDLINLAKLILIFISKLSFAYFPKIFEYPCLTFN